LRGRRWWDNGFADIARHRWTGRVDLAAGERHRVARMRRRQAGVLGCSDRDTGESAGGRGASGSNTGAGIAVRRRYGARILRSAGVWASGGSGVRETAGCRDRFGRGSPEGAGRRNGDAVCGPQSASAGARSGDDVHRLHQGRLSGRWTCCTWGGSPGWLQTARSRASRRLGLEAAGVLLAATVAVV
jgi:hypothetical protein